jgi:hypothetical protein
MSQDRKPPAYLEYASTMLADRKFRLMTASERGIFWTMRLESWANETLPAEPSKLAAILGLDAAKVASALPAVMPFFVVENGEIRCPEIDKYRAHIEARHLALSASGRRGASITNDAKKNKRKPKSRAGQGMAGDSATPTATPSATLTASPSGLTRPLNTIQPNQNQPRFSKEGVSDDAWIADYERFETEIEPKRVRRTV